MAFIEKPRKLDQGFYRKSTGLKEFDEILYTKVLVKCTLYTYTEYILLKGFFILSPNVRVWLLRSVDGFISKDRSRLNTEKMTFYNPPSKEKYANKPRSDESKLCRGSKKGAQLQGFRISAWHLFTNNPLGEWSNWRRHIESQGNFAVQKPVFCKPIERQVNGNPMEKVKTKIVSILIYTLMTIFHL